MSAAHPPVIAIDGPSASGKGTVAFLVAGALGFHYLNSGALYRLVALSARRNGLGVEDEAGLAALAATLPVDFSGEAVFFEGKRVNEDIATEDCAADASRVAARPGVRAALFARQRAFCRPPGLVAEGRDMGSIVFPDAVLKVFLVASAEARAERRLKQLKQKGITATLPDLLKDLRERDARDATRSVAPLKPGPGARWLDTTALSAAQAAERVLQWYRAGPGG